MLQKVELLAVNHFINFLCICLQIELFCLEQSRVCGSYISAEQHPGMDKACRNFHIFYQMLAGLSKVLSIEKNASAHSIHSSVHGQK